MSSLAMCNDLMNPAVGHAQAMEGTVGVAMVVVAAGAGADEVVAVAMSGPICFMRCAKRGAAPRCQVCLRRSSQGT